MMSWELGVRKEPPMNRDVMTDNLCAVQDAMNEAKIPFFLYMGTLLGAIRDRDFIEWDDDADLGAFTIDKDRLEIVERILIKRGFYIPKKDVPPEDSFFIKGGEKIDIWWFTRNAETNQYDYAPERCPKWPSYQAKYLDVLETVEFKGRTFLTPANPVEFLEKHYGKDWRIATRERGWIF